MVLLLVDPRIQDFDIITLQEPQTNLYQDITYCLRVALFLLVYLLEKGRYYFLINKKLNISTQEPSFASLDLGLIQIQARGRKIQIYNIYNQPPNSHSDISSLMPIPMLIDLLEQEGEYIVLRDFNLYYLLQYEIQNPTIYKAIDQLIDILYIYISSILYSYIALL